MISVITLTGTPSTFVPSEPAQQITVGSFPANNPNFACGFLLTNEVVILQRNGVTGAQACIQITEIRKLLVAKNPLLTYAPLITAQATNQSTTATVAAPAFSIVAVGEFDSTYPITYQWQVSTDGGTSFNNTVDGGIYSGSLTNSLVVTPPDTTFNNNLYVCVATNAAGSTLSNSAVLTVT